MAVSKSRDLTLELAVLHERVAMLESMLHTTQEALLKAVGQPVIVNVGGPNDPGITTGPGFGQLARATMANADAPEEPAPTPPPAKREVHWFKADGSDPNSDPTPTPDEA